jgi:hypothetical protein
MSKPRYRCSYERACWVLGADFSPALYPVRLV